MENNRIFSAEQNMNGRKPEMSYSLTHRNEVCRPNAIHGEGLMEKVIPEEEFTPECNPRRMTHGEGAEFLLVLMSKRKGVYLFMPHTMQTARAKEQPLSRSHERESAVPNALV